MRLRMKNSSNVQKSCYFSGALWVGSLTDLIEQVTKLKINPSFWTDCKLYSFLIHFFTHCSSAILAIMSVEKFVALFYPLHSKRMCNIKVAKLVCLTAAFLFIVVNFYLIMVAKVSKNHTGFEKCTFGHYGSLVMSYFDFTFYSFGPFVVMCVANIFIVSKLLILKYRGHNQTNQLVNQSVNKSALRGAVMLVSVSLTFIILTTPISLFFFKLIPSSNMIETIVFIVATLNHSINGFLYCLFGSKFRKELIKLVCRCKHNRIEASTSENTVTNTADHRY